MSNNHIDAYFTSMSKKDMAEVAKHLADEAVLLSPVFPEPFIGKESILPILNGVTETVDSLEPEFTMHAGDDAGVVFTLKCEDIRVKGVEHLHVNADGLIDKIEVAWRPLPSVVLLQQKLAQKLGGQPLRLVPAE